MDRESERPTPDEIPADVAVSEGSTSRATPAPDSPELGPTRQAVVEAPTVISTVPQPHRPAPPVAPKSTHEIGRSLEGHRLNHFQLDRFVGGGGMGAVFPATDLELHRVVAVKILTHRCEVGTVRRFRVEAQSAARLNHDNIARVYMVGESDGWNYIVFEFVDGENLRDLVAHQGPLRIEQATSIFAQITNALVHASSQSVVHRDIKPSNILLTPDGRAKLVDMGLARLRHVESEAEELTASGVTLGTFDYISPEQGHDPRNADSRSDLYSLGCTMYYVLTGRPPFSDGTPLQKLLKHAGEMPRDPRELRPEIPAELVDILLRLLAKEPNQRYQHPRELLNDLARLGEGLGIAVATSSFLSPSRDTISRREWRRHAPWLIPSAILLLVWGLLQWRSMESNPTLPTIPRPIESSLTRQAASPGAGTTTESSDSSRP